MFCLTEHHMGTIHRNYNLSYFQIKTSVSSSEITFKVILIFALMFLMTAVTLLHQIVT